MTHQTSRRQTIHLIGAAGLSALVGCGSNRSASGGSARCPAAGERKSVADAGLGCIVRPCQTEGPYFVDEGLNRSDIRSDVQNGSVSAGTPLRLVVGVHGIEGESCSPLSNAMVDVWHCDALGIYSDVADGSGLFDTRGQKFLRGYQLTNAQGIAEFVTIYPGWYPGRTVHIHFKVRTTADGQSSGEFTSQLYFDDAVTDTVFAATPYNTKGARSTRNEQDGIFLSGGSELMLNLKQEGAGYLASFDLGLLLV